MWRPPQSPWNFRRTAKDKAKLTMALSANRAQTPREPDSSGFRHELTRTVLCRAAEVRVRKQLAQPRLVGLRPHPARNTAGRFALLGRAKH